MSSDMNRVNIIGRLTRDPEKRQIPSGTSVTNFAIACNYVYSQNGEKKEQSHFFNCIVWGKGAEIFAQYAKKGQRVAIDGRLQQRRWEDKEGNKRNTVEIVTDNFQFLSYAQDQRQGGQSNQSGLYQPGDRTYPDNASSEPPPSEQLNNSCQSGDETNPDDPYDLSTFSYDEIPF